jgi:hypothetical protein
MALIKTFIVLVLLIQVTFIGWSVHCLSSGTKSVSVHATCLVLNLLFGAVNVKNLTRSRADWISAEDGSTGQKPVWIQTPE